MRHFKSERLKKLESELQDLEQWLKLGLVPKKDINKHKEEIVAIQAKIEEEKERLQFLKESGETEDYIAPKRPTARSGYTEMPTLPDIDVQETAGGFHDTGFELETEMESEGTSLEDRDEEERTQSDETEDEESYFSDKNRWRRGRDIVDPDADAW